MKNRSRKLYLTAVFLIIFHSLAYAGEMWKITAYDACEKCCGKKVTDRWYGICASGKSAKVGYCACNWLEFGTRLKISGLGIYEVQDRGAKSHFGSFDNKIKHVDIYFKTHEQAREFGVKYLEVEVLE